MLLRFLPLLLLLLLPLPALSCEQVSVRACKKGGCKDFHYGCQDSPFCDFTQGSPLLQQRQCNKTPGCVWTGDRCEVQTPTSAPTPSPSSFPSATGFPPTTVITLPGALDTSRFNIDLVYIVPVSDEIALAVERARNRWMNVVVGDIPSTFLYKAGMTCFGRYPAPKDIVVDDLLVVLEITEFDGPYGILASGGPCQITGKQPRVGLIRLDIVDVERMLAEGSLESVVMHEMGHILGVGTLWNYNDLVTDPLSPPVYYIGQGGMQGTLEVDEASGREISSDKRPVVELFGGEGTAFTHWAETVYDTELMTGYLDSHTPLSPITALSLQDSGYVVSDIGVDVYVWPDESRRRLRRRGKNNPEEHVHGQEDIKEGERMEGVPEQGEATPYN